MLLTLDRIYKSIDDGEATVLVSLDLSAAFDTIDHQLLLTRLSGSFGVSGTSLCWIKSYLSGRSQMVSIGASRSPPAKRVHEWGTAGLGTWSYLVHSVRCTHRCSCIQPFHPPAAVCRRCAVIHCFICGKSTCRPVEVGEVSGRPTRLVQQKWTGSKPR